MNLDKIKRLEVHGWKVGRAEEFLGLSNEETKQVEKRMSKLIEQIRLQQIPYVHSGYVEINHCINNLNEVIWEIAKGRDVSRYKEDKFAFLLVPDIADNLLSIRDIAGNVLGSDYTLSFSDSSKSYDERARNKNKGYLELKLWDNPSIFIFTETKDDRDLNVGKELECARFITQLCNMVRVVKCAPPYPHKWKENE
jgi:hypothetical protein